MTEPPLTTHHSPLTKTDWLLLGVLLALVLPLRLWLIGNTEVTAHDSIGYIRYALQFEQYTWKETLLKNHQHPGYPALVWLMSQPVRAIDGATTPENMELSAQLVNLFASLLLMLPMYFLGRQFFDRPVSFLATLLYQYLPISAQHLSDGISEPIFLVLIVSGLLQAVHAVRERSVWRCQLLGLFAGLAYLTRPEGALLLPAFGCVLIARQLHAPWRCSWQRFFECGTSAAISAALVGSIYVGATGQLSNKPTFHVMTRQAEVSSIHSSDAGGHLFAATFTKTDNQTLRFTRSVWAVVSEINQGFHYAAGVPALLGLWWSFSTLRRQPGFWVLFAYVAIHGSVLIALGMVASYVSDRHVMILVLLGCFFAVAGLRELPRRLLASFKMSETRAAPVWFAILFLILIGACLPKATQRLHGNRAGNHAAGLWLHDRLQPGDHVEDDHAWSHFFAGMVFQERYNPELPPDVVPTCYVVATRSRDPLIDAQRHAAGIAKNAEIVYVWPDRAEVDKARIVVYAQPRNWKTQKWRKAAK